VRARELAELPAPGVGGIQLDADEEGGAQDGMTAQTAIAVPGKIGLPSTIAGFSRTTLTPSRGSGAGRTSTPPSAARLDRNSGSSGIDVGAGKEPVSMDTA